MSKRLSTKVRRSFVIKSNHKELGEMLAELLKLLNIDELHIMTYKDRIDVFATKEMNLTITSDNPNVSIENNTVNVKPGQWTEVTLKIKGEGSTKLTFAPDSPMYLDDILVTDNLTSDIDNIAIDNNSAKQNGVYSLSGQHIAKTLSNLPAGIYIVNGKKVIVK